MVEVIVRSASKNDIPIILGLLYELGRSKPKKDLEVDVFRNLAKKYLSDSDKEIWQCNKGARIRYNCWVLNWRK